MISKLAEKLRDPEYRKAFVASQINIGIPFQIRALLKADGKTQEWLAKKTGMLQPRISGLMTPGRTRPNIETLRRLAEAFDCGLAVRFVPFSELARWTDDFDPEHFNVPRFDEDLGFVDRKPVAKVTTSNVNIAAAVGGTTDDTIAIAGQRIGATPHIGGRSAEVIRFDSHRTGAHA
jgi:transcriptional regulator with XRE-family HTH domain